MAELAWYLPIAFAGRELVRLGARVVRIEPPDGDPLRRTAPGGTAHSGAARSPSPATSAPTRHSPSRSAPVRTSCSRAPARRGGPARDRPGRPACVARALLDHRLRRRMGATHSAPGTTSTTSAGRASSRTRRRGRRSHRRPRRRRARRGDGDPRRARPAARAPARGAARVSMTHRSHALVEHRLGGDPGDRLLTGASRATASTRRPTVAGSRSQRSSRGSSRRCAR